MLLPATLYRELRIGTSLLIADQLSDSNRGTPSNQFIRCLGSATPGFAFPRPGPVNHLYWTRWCPNVVTFYQLLCQSPPKRYSHRANQLFFMVKFALKHKLLRSRRLERLRTSKLSYLNLTQPPPQQPVRTSTSTSEQLVTHLEPIRYLRPFYQGGRIEVVDSQIYSCFKNQVLYADKLIKHNQEEIANFAVNHTNTHIATFTRNYMLRYCTLADHTVLFTQKIEPLFPVDMAYSPEDVFLALGGTNCIVRILNVKNQATATEFRVSGSVLKVAWHPALRKLQLAVATDDRRISLFDLVANRVLCAFVDFANRITGLAFNQHILATTNAKELKLWDTANQQLADTIKAPVEMEALLLVKQTFVIGTASGEILIKPMNKPFQSDNQLEGQQILKLMHSKDRVYIATSELHVYIAHLENQQLVVERLLLGFNDEVLACKFIPGNRLLLATNSPFMKMVDLDSLDVIAWKAHYSSIMCAQYMDDLIITGSKDNAVSIFKDVGTAAPIFLHKYTGHSDDVISIDVTRRLIASVSADKTLKIWDLKRYDSDQSLKTVVAHEKDINAVRFSPNAKLVATSSQDRLIKIWDENLMLKMVLKGHKRGVWEIEFSPTEKLLASASGDNTVKVWNLADGTTIKNFQGATAQLKVQWLFRGQELLSGDANGTLKLWNLKKQVCVNTFAAHEGKIYGLDVKRENDDLVLVTGADDSTVIIWKDKTVQVSQEEQLKQHEIKIKLQNFANLMREKQFVRAAFLAYQNKYIKHFIEAATSILNAEDENGILELSKLLIDDDLAEYLALLCQLTVSRKTIALSQQLFYASIKQGKPDFEKNKEKKDQIKRLLQQFRVASLKYLDRTEQNYRQTFLLKYMVDKNKIVE